MHLVSTAAFTAYHEKVFSSVAQKKGPNQMETVYQDGSVFRVFTLVISPLL